MSVNLMIICGINDDSLRERLLTEADLNLAKAVKLVYASEQTNILNILNAHCSNVWY